ncbi:peptide deformylase [Patescibacteria group bacterium]|nr:peptide deformylase [Patescibacteria group bacterium]
MRQLIKLPNDLLRQKSKPVGAIDAAVRELAGEMVEFILQHQDVKIKPVGLSAVQLGEPVRMFAFVSNPEAGRGVSVDTNIIINPELVYMKGTRRVTEACLSVPGKTFNLKRAKIVKIRGLTLDGQLRSFRGRDFMAQVFQHEYDHLEGILVDQRSKEI